MPKSIEKKLLVLMLVVCVFPAAMLLTSLFSGIWQTESIVAAVICQIMGVAVGYFWASGIIRQSESINETLAKINQGNFEARAESVTSDELGSAAKAINSICDNTLNLIQSNDEREKIQASIEKLISEMKEIAAGNLTIKTEARDDMTGAISHTVNHMTEQLRTIIERVKSAAEEVTSTSIDVCEASADISDLSDEQSHRIADASKQLMTMTNSFQEVADLTNESKLVAIEARQTASNGLKAVSDTVDGMQRIRDQVQNTSKRIKKFGESSQEIGEIVQMISDIADRTSILALNASIQASMAGEAGQGFAIVAEEIERLAERSTDATKQISKLIRTIQNDTTEVISEMEESTREVVAGSTLASQAGATLFEIDSVSSQLVELIENASDSALNQADSATTVAQKMSAISQDTKTNADKSREATHAIGLLAEMANGLRESVSRFRLDDENHPSPTDAKIDAKAAAVNGQSKQPKIFTKQKSGVFQNKPVQKPAASTAQSGPRPALRPSVNSRPVVQPRAVVKPQGAVQPQRAQPQKVQPQKVQPQKVQPQKVQPQGVQPQPMSPPSPVIQSSPANQPTRNKQLASSNSNPNTLESKDIDRARPTAQQSFVAPPSDSSAINPSRMPAPKPVSIAPPQPRHSAPTINSDVNGASQQIQAAGTSNTKRNGFDQKAFVQEAIDSVDKRNRRPVATIPDNANTHQNSTNSESQKLSVDQRGKIAPGNRTVVQKTMSSDGPGNNSGDKDSVLEEQKRDEHLLQQLREASEFIQKMKASGTDNGPETPVSSNSPTSPAHTTGDKK